MENALLSNTAAAAGTSGSSTRTLGGSKLGFQLMLTLVQVVLVRTVGLLEQTELKTFTETLLRSTLKTTWDSGGNPNVIMLNGFNKQKLSFF